ncbi:hypothetical protein Aduo_010021 [Ancylostoma duodenale]
MKAWATATFLILLVAVSTEYNTIKGMLEQLEAHVGPPNPKRPSNYDENAGKVMFGKDGWQQQQQLMPG